MDRLVLLLVALLLLGLVVIIVLPVKQTARQAEPPLPTLFSGETIFFDDFEGDPKSIWAASSGTWIWQHGRLTVQEPLVDAWFKIYVKSKDSLLWENYAVEVDVFDADADWEGGIIIRAQDDRNQIMLQWQHDHNLSLSILIDGRETRCDNAFARPGLTAKARVRVEAIRDTYAAYVRQGEQGDLIKRLSCQNHTFIHGMPGLAVRGERTYARRATTAFDNFKIIRLPAQ